MTWTTPTAAIKFLAAVAVLAAAIGEDVSEMLEAALAALRRIWEN